MRATVDVTELRRDLSRYVRRVERGERLLITDHGKPVAELGPPSTSRAPLDQLIVEGRLQPPARRGIPAGLKLDGDTYALSSALAEIRGARAE